MKPDIRIAAFALATLLLGVAAVPSMVAAQEEQIEREQLPPIDLQPGEILEIPPEEPVPPDAAEQPVDPGQELPPPQAEEGTPSIEDIQPTPEKKETRVKNPVAEFAGLDKITGRTIAFDVYVNETVQFGALQVTPKVCYSRPDAEEPKTDTFVEVDEITLDRKIRRIFTGWMFAESPGISAVEHPVYDVWLKSCKQKSDVPPPETAKTN